MPENAKKPAIRFAGFDDAWEQRKLSELGKIHTGNTPPTSERENWAKDENGYVWITPTDINALKMSDSERHLTAVGWGKARSVPSNSVLITSIASIGKNTVNTVPAAFNQQINAIAPIENSAYFILTAMENEKTRFARLAGQTATAIINKTEFEKFPLFVPNLQEQERLSGFFENFDNLITLHQRKYDKLVSVKKSMLEKMFPKNGSNKPEIRFSGFTDPWEQRKLGDLMNVGSVKRIHQSDWTSTGIRFLRARDIVSAAKNEEPSDYLYISEERYREYSTLSGKVQKGDLLVTGVGTIGVPFLIVDDTEIYFKDGNIIWFKNGGVLDGRFFYYSFISERIQSFIKESAGIGTVGTYTIDSGKKTPIMLPDVREQKQLGLFFTQLDNLITLHQRELEKLKNIKKSMLEKMFV